MMPRSDERIASFDIEKWQPLTDLPGQAALTKSTAGTMATATAPKANQDKTRPHNGDHSMLVGVNPTLAKLLYDLMVYLYSSVTVLIKRLGISARAFETAKLEGCEKRFILESAAGATTYLIPTPKAFEAMGFPCPYDLTSIEHSYYQGLCGFLLEKDPANRSVHTELKVGDSGSTADIVTVAHDGARRAYEVTLSTGNILRHAAQYAQADFVQIVFLCRDYRLREAVRACCREGGLNPDLLAKLDYWQFSTLLRRQHTPSHH